MLKRRIIVWLAALAATALCNPATAVGSDPVIAAAGDIACDPANSNYNAGLGTATSCRQQYTSDLLADQGLAAVLPLGDNQYEDGALLKYQTVFHATWGRVDPIIRPVPGNHEYAPGAAGYFDYFDGINQSNGPAGERGKGYYSVDVGTWHLIALNSNCGAIDAGSASDGCAAGSPQELWLKSDLALHTNSCLLAYWHHPLFTSAWVGSATSMRPIWQDLYDAHADVVLNGHAHAYERFALQDPNGLADAAHGTREFVVGTGGEDHHAFNATPADNSEVRNSDTFGVLDLTLHPRSYNWQFVPEAGATFTDTGSYSCHNPQPAPAAPSIAAPADNSYSNTGTVALSGTAEANSTVTVYDGATSKATTTANYSGSWSKTLSSVADGAHSYTATATDAASNTSPPSTAVTVTVDTASPSSSASSPQSSNSTTITASYSAADNGSSSGLASVELWAKRPGESSYSKAATDTAPASTGSFSYNASAGDGSYSFYTIAVDNAANREAAPANPDSSTQLDTAAPATGGGGSVTDGGSATLTTQPPPLSTLPFVHPKAVTTWSIPAIQRLGSGKLLGYVTLGQSNSTVAGDAVADTKTRRALAAKSTVIARSIRRGVKAGRFKVVVRLSTRVRKGLKKLRKAMITLRIIVTPARGRPVIVSRAITLRR